VRRRRPSRRPQAPPLIPFRTASDYQEYDYEDYFGSEDTRPIEPATEVDREDLDGQEAIDDKSDRTFATIATDQTNDSTNENTNGNTNTNTNTNSRSLKRRLPVPGIRQPPLERRRRAVLLQPPFLRRMQMEGNRGQAGQNTPQQAQHHNSNLWRHNTFSTAFNPDDVTWEELDERKTTTTVRPSTSLRQDDEPEDGTETLFDRLSGFMYDDMDIVMDYLEENGGPVVQLVNEQVDGIMKQVGTEMREHPGNTCSCTYLPTPPA
jgi:hypothetical protein